MMRELERKLQSDGLDWDHEIHHIACLNHVINLAIEAFFKSIKVLNTSMHDTDEDRDENDVDQVNLNDPDDDDNEDDDIYIEMELLSAEFKLTMEKIHKIVKV